MTQNRLNQIAFSVLVQLAKKNDLKPYMTKNARKIQGVLSRVPEYLVRNNVFIVPDRPETAIGAQEIDVDKILSFMMNKDGGGKFLPSLDKIEEKGKLTTLNQRSKDDPDTVTQKNEITSRLEFYVKTIFKRAKLVNQAKRYYDAAKEDFESLPARGLENCVPVSRYQKAYRSVLRESELLSSKLDALAMAYLFYVRTRSEVILSGFSTKPYDKAIEELEKTSLPEFGMPYKPQQVPRETPKPMG